MKTSTLTRIAVNLTLSSPEMAPYLEELLWTVDGVESVTYCLDGEEDFKGFQVIGVSSEMAEQIQALCEAHGLRDVVSIQAVQSVEEEDWAESWKRYWHTNRVLPHLVIQPSWEPFTPEPDDIVLRLDPGSAFGTGTHETTQLMLFLLNEIFALPETDAPSVLDVGTGSGILTIYAAKLGASSCLAIDNDENAVNVAQENVIANQVDQQVCCSSQPLEQAAPQAFDIVLANILASVIKVLMPNLIRTLAPQGQLLLSGITRKQLPEMQACLNAHNLVLSRMIQKGDWIALVCQRSS